MSRTELLLRVVARMCLGRGVTPGVSLAEMYSLESKSSVRRRLRDMLVPVASGRKAGSLAQSGKGSKPGRLPRLRHSAQPIRDGRPRELWEDSRSKDSAMDRSNSEAFGGVHPTRNLRWLADARGSDHRGRPAHQGPMADFRVGSMASGSGSGFGSGFEVGVAPGVALRGVGVRRGGA